MPTYQYACTACDEQLEAVQAFTDAALTDCPACGGRLRKVYSAVGVVFKGSGFYKTDSRAGDAGSKPSADTSSGRSSGSSSESSSSSPSTSSTGSSTASSGSSSSSSGTGSPAAAAS